MAKQLQLRRGSTTDHASFTGALGEVTVDTDKDTVVVHDNATAGGVPLATEGWLSSKPHIIPDVLYPAVAHLKLDGNVTTSRTNGPNGTTLGTATRYGSVQTDGRMYYYTDIKGSKPIKDPRIGSHFGSQRHKFRHSELLEQETATHGKNVYSVDGREWIRAVDVAGTLDTGVNDSNGQRSIQFNSTNTGSFYEATGYFSDVNTLVWTRNDFQNDMDVFIDGTRVVDGSTTIGGRTTVASPLAGRYVDASSVVNALPDVSLSLGIHTIKFLCVGGSYWIPFGIELIAQDTSNVNNIQIPSQNVVSYGKKFTVAGTPHYDPFNGFTNLTTLHSANVDTATSLGLDTSTTYGASWTKDADEHIRPFNGGRVVKWVDSSGTIKTSVTMMPRNAQNIGNNNLNGSAGTASNEISQATLNGASTTNAHTINFSDDVLNASLSEVAKTFHHREFGNGGANGNALYRDATVSLSSTDMAYVMDDGLTSLSGKEVTSSSTAFYPGGTDKYWYLTFIGTGISVTGINGTANLAMNLPYGTHILKYTRLGTTTDSPWLLDGIDIRHSWGSGSNESHAEQFTFHQPKMPPIPEDAVVLADYMLMADYVKSSAGLSNNLSKGIRLVSTSRDCFHDVTSGAFTPTSVDHNSSRVPFGFGGLSTTVNNAGRCKLPAFGTHMEIQSYGHRGDIFVDGTDMDQAETGSGESALSTQDVASTLGVHEFESRAQSSNHNISIIGVVTPIHTSSHYQSFETPFLQELVGGDRNMEQTNLVVTPDGKTWDEVTRDTSYVTNKSGYVATVDGVSGGFSNTTIKPDVFRGHGGSYEFFDCWNKDFAIAYDRFICLKEGMYRISYTLFSSANNGGVLAYLQLNDSTVGHANRVASAVGNTGGGTGNLTWRSMAFMEATIYLKRGDFICATADSGATIHGGTDGMNKFQAERVG